LARNRRLNTTEKAEKLDVYGFIDRHPEAQYHVEAVLRVLQQRRAATLEEAWEVARTRVSSRPRK
jgi:hypothetical protein